LKRTGHSRDVEHGRAAKHGRATKHGRAAKYGSAARQTWQSRVRSSAIRSLFMKLRVSEIGYRSVNSQSIGFPH
jgi:hypothetical protein